MIENPQPETEKGFFARIGENVGNLFGAKKIIGNQIHARLQSKILEAEAKYQDEVYLKFQHDANGEVEAVCCSWKTHQILSRSSFKEILYSEETIKDAKNELAMWIENPEGILPAVEEKAKQLIPKGHYFMATKSDKTKKARIFLYQNGVKNPIKSNIKLSELM